MVFKNDSRDSLIIISNKFGVDKKNIGSISFFLNPVSFIPRYIIVSSLTLAKIGHSSKICSKLRDGPGFVQVQGNRLSLILKAVSVIDDSNIFCAFLLFWDIFSHIFNFSRFTSKLHKFLLDIDSCWVFKSLLVASSSSDIFFLSGSSPRREFSGRLQFLICLLPFLSGSMCH